MKSNYSVYAQRTGIQKLLCGGVYYTKRVASRSFRTSAGSSTASCPGTIALEFSDTPATLDRRCKCQINFTGYSLYNDDFGEDVISAWRIGSLLWNETTTDPDAAKIDYTLKDLYWHATRYLQTGTQTQHLSLNASALVAADNKLCTTVKNTLTSGRDVSYWGPGEGIATGSK